MSSEQDVLRNRRLADRPRRVISAVVMAIAITACGGTVEPEREAVASVDDLVTTTSTTEQAADDPSTTVADTTTTTEAEEMSPIEEQELALLDLSACMRDEGIDNFPDVGVDNNGAINVAAVFQAGVDLQSTEFADALEACNDNVQDITFGASALPDPADIVDQLFEFTQCVRDEGVDVGDVAVTDLLARRGSVPADVTSREEGIAYFFQLDPEDPAALAAIGECEGELAGLPGAG